MDPRKGKHVASGSRGRGRANRPQPIRVPQTPVYRPLPPSPCDVYYTQPSYQYNIRPPPMNPYNYIVQQTAEFDLFPTEEEPVQEAEEEEIVAETQQPQNGNLFYLFFSVFYFFLFLCKIICFVLIKI